VKTAAFACALITRCVADLLRAPNDSPLSVGYFSCYWVYPVFRIFLNEIQHPRVVIAKKYGFLGTAYYKAIYFYDLVAAVLPNPVAKVRESEIEVLLVEVEVWTDSYCDIRCKGHDFIVNPEIGSLLNCNRIVARKKGIFILSVDQNFPPKIAQNTGMGQD